ncbi:MAG: thermonuclease family protein [Thermodesulfobacteriota bacterium]
MAGGPAGRAERVVDGDTLWLEDGRKVRLAGLDAPEMGRPEEGRAEQFFAANATALLESLVMGRDLQVESLGRDDYGRILGLVSADGVLVNEAMLERGAAFYLYFPGRPSGLDGRLLAAQARAMDAGAGFWPRIASLPEANRPWVVNKKSGRAFPAASKEARSVSSGHRAAFPTLTDAMRKGYAPARHLTPWPPAGD